MEMADQTMIFDLDNILAVKADGESANIAKKAKRNLWEAYRRMHKWFTKITGPSLQEKMMKITTPLPITKADQILETTRGLGNNDFENGSIWILKVTKEC